MKTLISILKTLPPAKVIDDVIDSSKYFPLDLSSTNTELVESKPESAADFERFITDYLKRNNAKLLMADILKGALCTNEVLFLEMIQFKNEIFI